MDMEVGKVCQGLVEAVLGVEDSQVREVKQVEAEKLGKVVTQAGETVEAGARKGDRVVRGVDVQEVGMKGEEVVIKGCEVV